MHSPPEKLGAAAKARLRELKADLRGGRPERLTEQLRDDVSALAAQDGPVLVGPFTGEVGFELLYWIPLVRWAVREVPSLAGRLVIVSRGGAQHWWTGYLDVDYIDVLSLYEPGEYLARKGADKQRKSKEFDDEILDRVRSRLGVASAAVFHPSLLFDLYYRGRKTRPDIFARQVVHDAGGATGLASLYDPMRRPEPRSELVRLLPDDFVAARFYFRESFPDDEANRSFAGAMIARLSKRHPVVLLNNRLELDEHRDLELSGENVVTIDELMTPADNLSVQTEVLGRARAFVGTYGGLAYLAPLLGVPAVGFSSSPEHAGWWHLALAQRIFSGDAWAPLMTLRPHDVPLLDLLGGGHDPEA